MDNLPKGTPLTLDVRFVQPTDSPDVSAVTITEWDGKTKTVFVRDILLNEPDHAPRLVEPQDRTPQEILVSARNLITNPERWSRFSSAVDHNEQPVRSDNPNAVRWGAIGAVYVCGDRYQATLAAIEMLKDNAAPDFSICAINGRPDGHARILDLFDRTITKNPAR